MISKPYRPNVAIVVIDGKGGVLVGERADLRGVWQLPQGGIEPGETAEEAARRELAEEIGVEGAEILAVSDSWYSYDFPEWLSDAPIARTYRGQTQRYVVARLPEGLAPDPARSDGEFVAFAWVSPSQVLDQIVDFKKNAYAKAFSDLSDWINPKL